MELTQIATKVATHFRYNEFAPVTKSHVESGNTSTSKKVAAVKNFLIDRHNQNWVFKGNLKTQHSPTTTILGDHLPKSVTKFLNHQEAIAINPFTYAMDAENNSAIRRGFDLVVGGPVAALADTITIVVYGLYAFISGLFALVEMALGVEESKDNAKGAFEDALYCAVSTIRCALRMTPLIGAFLGYGFTILTQSAAYGINSAINTISDSTKGRQGNTLTTYREYDNSDL